MRPFCICLIIKLNIFLRNGFERGLTLTVPLKSKLPPLVSRLARRDSRRARRETRLARRESRLARRESRLARTTEAYILEYISSNWLARKRFISRDGFAAMYMYAS